jgi:hypothetical protein
MESAPLDIQSRSQFCVCIPYLGHQCAFVLAPASAAAEALARYFQCHARRLQTRRHDAQLAALQTRGVCAGRERERSSQLAISLATQVATTRLAVWLVATQTRSLSPARGTLGNRYPNRGDAFPHLPRSQPDPRGFNDLGGAGVAATRFG